MQKMDTKCPIFRHATAMPDIRAPDAVLKVRGLECNSMDK